ncbi:MAG: deacetylase [Sedimenticola selenatireducens]|uniref:Deacetylase n=1 Tax=Sedimenticola selenatireducens TaxID=191960 RepID=A0A2N6CSJ2_9GAMM|nr:histone deacetylase family protein [Sedimenticola selenatireducens]PLX60067.1 MAG: deacetylase [Sedimenticola selenatireducens]
MPIAYISHPDCLLHDVGQDHPEQPGRLRAIHDLLISTGMELALNQYEAPLAKREQLELAHDPDYISMLFTDAPHEGILELDGDTFMMPNTLNAALRAVGGVVMGVDLVMSKEVTSAFCAIRPPGHHAERYRAMGFCYFNNVAVGAAHAIAQYGLERVAIIDFDVHHGNGTEHIFATDPRVLFCSSFQHPFYPFTGHETDTDHIVNITLPAGANGAEFRKQVEAHWVPALHHFKPQLVMISAGFDAHISDDMSHLRLREADYDWVTSLLKDIADQYAEGRIVSTLEGGYEHGSLARSVLAHLDALLGHR